MTPAPKMTKPASNDSVMSALISRGNSDVCSHMLNYLQPQELAAVEKTNRAWNQIAKTCWEDQAATQEMIPESIPDHLTFTSIFKQLHPDSFGPQVYREYIGDPWPIVPIPDAYIQTRIFRNFFQLTFIPEFIKLRVSKESHLCLHANGMLSEDPDAAGKERTIDVPTTMRNVVKIVEKYLKKGSPIRAFGPSWDDVLNQHGNTRVKSHWFYPRKKAIGFRKSYQQQKNIAATERLEITPLIDTTIYFLLRQIISNCHQPSFPVRTSTLTEYIEIPNVKYPTSLYWVSETHLFFGEPASDFNSYGAVVGVPDRKP